MTKILLVGDTHGEAGLAKLLTQYAHQTQHDMIIQLGDFGFGWRDKGDGDVWLNEVSAAAQNYDIPWTFIDGNHDNHPLLWRTQMPIGVSYVNRGDVREFDGVTIGFLGGGVSVDQNWRIVGKSWWPTEELSDDEFWFAHDTFIAAKPQVILSHDAPESFPALKHRKTDAEMASIWPRETLMLAAKHRGRIQQIFDAHKPELWVHGHYHYRYDANVDGCFAVGLSNADDSIRLSVITLITEDGNWTLKDLG